MTDTTQNTEPTQTTAEIVTDKIADDKTAPVDEKTNTKTDDAPKVAQDEDKPTKPTKTAKTSRKNTAIINDSIIATATTSHSGDKPTDNNLGTTADTATDTVKPIVEDADKPASTATADTATDTVKPIAKDADKPTATSSDDTVKVTNGWHDNLLEPATGTILPHGETTEIKVTKKANRERILRNLEQINFIHGKKLTIE